MKKLAFLLVLVVAFALVGGAALAAETPHGPFDANSAVCAACHRAHTSSAEYLLATPKVTSLCIACHDGSGADTNVVGGVFVVNGTQLDKDDNIAPLTPMDNGYNHGTWGAAASPLMGGGFNQMSAGIGTATNTTSRHMNPTGGAATTLFSLQFGDGATGPGSVKNFLDCVDCHMPHRSLNYRMLRMAPTGYVGTDLSVPPSASVVSQNVVVDNAAYPGGNAAEITDYATNKGRRYTEDSGMFNTTITDPTLVSGGASVSKWCGLGCHDFYYRSAVRANNSSGTGNLIAGASPNMTTRIATTMSAAEVARTIIYVDDASQITTGPNKVTIDGLNYGVDSINLVPTPDAVTLSTSIPAGTLYAGTPVKFAGKGMEVYYDLTGDTVADATFMHAIDVDLSYMPRNGSSTAIQTLAANLGPAGNGFANAYGADKLPVADFNANGAYNNGDYMTCLTCHRAHGSDVAMAGDSIIPSRNFGNLDADGFPAGTNSMLLRLDSRGVCQQCHMMPRGF